MANDWNLENPLATCSLEVVGAGDLVAIRLFKKDVEDGSGKVLLVQAPIDIGRDPKHKSSTLEYFVEPAVDTSRYFVLRVQDIKSKRIGRIGVGFREREVAFTFLAVLRDHFRHVKNEREAEQNVAAVEESMQDFSLKSGEKIKMSFRIPRPPRQKKKNKKNKKSNGLQLKAPPALRLQMWRMQRAPVKTAVGTVEEDNNNGDDDDWVTSGLIMMIVVAIKKEPENYHFFLFLFSLFSLLSED